MAQDHRGIGQTFQDRGSFKDQKDEIDIWFEGFSCLGGRALQEQAGAVFIQEDWGQGARPDWPFVFEERRYSNRPDWDDGGTVGGGGIVVVPNIVLLAIAPSWDSKIKQRFYPGPIVRGALLWLLRFFSFMPALIIKKQIDSANVLKLTLVKLDNLKDNAQQLQLARLRGDLIKVQT